MSTIGRWAAVAMAAMVVGVPVLASGVSIYEQGARASGQGGAWVARADDAAANWYNPAAIVRSDGMQFQFGTTLVAVGYDTSLTTTEFGEPARTFDAVGSIVTPSHFYFTHKVDDHWGWGIGLNNPVGLVTEWDEPPMSLYARRSALATYVLNPNLAVAIDDHWSIAVGIDYMFANLEEFSLDVDQSALLQQQPFTTIGTSDVSGDGDDTSWNVAVLYVGEAISAGFNYRDGFDVAVDGTVAFTGIDPLLQDGGAIGQFCAGGRGCFPNGPADTVLGMPAQAAVGLAWDVGDAWTMEFDVSWTGWSSFDALALDFGNETSIPVDVGGGNFVQVPVVQDTTLRQDWKNTNAYRFGAAWTLGENHELRFGAVFDEGAIPAERVRPFIPDADRTSVTIGYGFTGERWNIDAFYMPVVFSDIDAVGGEEGVVAGTYSSTLHLAGVTFNLRF
jgi:long-chain fatty acid transport protein